MWRLPWHNQVFCVIISFFATKLLPNFVDSWFFIFETFSITPERKTCLHEYKNEKISVDFRELTKERASPYFHQFHLVTKLMQIKPIWKGTELWEAEIVLKAMTTMETQFRTQNLETYWDFAVLSWFIREIFTQKKTKSGAIWTQILDTLTKIVSGKPRSHPLTEKSKAFALRGFQKCITLHKNKYKPTPLPPYPPPSFDNILKEFILKL